MAAAAAPPTLKLWLKTPKLQEAGANSRCAPGEFEPPPSDQKNGKALKGPFRAREGEAGGAPPSAIDGTGVRGPGMKRARLIRLAQSPKERTPV